MLSLAMVITGCGSSSSIGTATTSQPSGTTTTSQPIGKSSPVPAPAVVGPITGGVRGRPWAGTVDALAPLAPYDFVQEEFFFSGTAQGRDHLGIPTGSVADYNSRMLVQRPRDPAHFNGTVIVEWYNETAEADMPFLWMLTHDELLREGYAYIGVSAQAAGVDTSPLALKFWDPVRYATLHHPGDDYEFDIYSQAARALFAQSSGPAPLGPLAPQRVIAVGGSQSAGYLISYANHVQREHRVLDGFFIHTWPGPIRADVGVPVLMLLTETELEGFTSPLGPQDPDSIPLLSTLPGFGSLRLPTPKLASDDHAKLRVWEIAGGSHGDQALIDYLSAELSQDLTAPVAQPLFLTAPAVCVRPPNDLHLGRPTMAALHRLNDWVTTGNAPPSQPRIVKQADGHLVRDADGFVQSGVRMPNYEAPVGLNRGDNCTFFGEYDVLTKAQLSARYTSTTDFEKKFSGAAARAVETGILLPPEAAAYVGEAGAVNLGN